MVIVTVYDLANKLTGTLIPKSIRPEPADSRILFVTNEGCSIEIVKLPPLSFRIEKKRVCESPWLKVYCLPGPPFTKYGLYSTGFGRTVKVIT